MVRSQLNTLGEWTPAAGGPAITVEISSVIPMIMIVIEDGQLYTTQIQVRNHMRDSHFG